MSKTLIAVLCLVILIFQAVAIGTSYWTVNQSNVFHSGMWQACATEMCTDIPVDGDTSYPTTELNAVRVFSILGMVFIVLFSLLMLAGKLVKAHVPLLVIGGLCSLISCVIWYAYLRDRAPLKVLPDSSLKPGYSFYLNLAAGLLVIPVLAVHAM
jgi:hypothetical protein